MHEIEQFLKQPEWGVGMRLIQKYSDNQALKFLFSLGESRDSLAKMKAELQAIWQVLPKTEPDPVTGTTEPEAIQLLKKQDIELFEQAKRLHAQLKTNVSTQDRYMIACEIRRIFRLKADLYAQIQYFEKEGKIWKERETFDLAGATDADLLKRAKTMGTYFSPSKVGKIKNPEEKRVEYESILNELKHRGL